MRRGNRCGVDLRTLHAADRAEEIITAARPASAAPPQVRGVAPRTGREGTIDRITGRPQYFS
jgi:hypothetical protein